MIPPSPLKILCPPLLDEFKGASAISPFWKSYHYFLSRGISEFGRLIFSGQFFKNPNSKLGAKFISTLILKDISWKNIEKYKSLCVLSQCVLCKNANQDMAIFGHTFFGHNSAIFWANRAEVFYGGSGDHYLSIGEEKSKMLVFVFWFFGPLLAGKWAWPPRTDSKPDQKVGQLGGPFGPTAISKSCFRNFLC